MNLAEIVSRAFGEGTDEEQAEILNGFADALLLACKYDKNKVEGQLCYVSNRLNRHAEDFITTLAGFVELKRRDTR